MFEWYKLRALLKRVKGMDAREFDVYTRDHPDQLDRLLTYFKDRQARYPMKDVVTAILLSSIEEDPKYFYRIGTAKHYKSATHCIKQCLTIAKAAKYKIIRDWRKR